MPGLAGHVLLATCNRWELYLDIAAPDGLECGDARVDAVASAVARLLELPVAAARQVLRVRRADDAARHLCRVAAGIESPIVGEAEILGQVDTALERASAQAAAGDALTALFRTALRAGRRARLETLIGHHATSVGSIAVQLAEEVAPRPAGNRALVIGAGAMARVAATRLQESGRFDVVIASRTFAHAETLAHAAGATAIPLAALAGALTGIDIVVTAASARVPILNVALLHTIAPARVRRPLAIIDLGMPRNVHPAVRALDDVTVFDTDDLRARVHRSLQRRRDEIPAVERIIEEELSEHGRRTRGATLLHLVHEWRHGAESVRRREVAHALDAVPGLTPEVAMHIERLTVTLVNRLLDEPTRRLRAEAANGHAEEVAAFTRRLLVGESAPHAPH